VAAAKDFGRLYKAKSRGKISTKQFKRFVVRLAQRSRSKNVHADLFKAIDSVPTTKKRRIVDIISSLIRPIESSLKKRRRFRR
jgi:hypothetical protein